MRSSVSRLQHTHQYVSRKVRRVRWQKLPETASIGGGVLPEKFATASWDAAGLDTNEIAIWHLVAEEVNPEDGKRRVGQAEVMDDDCYSLTNMPETDWRFVKSAAVEMDTDVHELQFINEDHILYATAQGHLVAAKWNRGDRSIRTVHTFDRIHMKDEACIGFSMFGNDVVSLGSSGTLTRVDLSAVGALRTGPLATPDGYQGVVSSWQYGPVLCIEHFGATEVVTGNAAGQLQLWDIRQRPQPRQQLPSNTQDMGAVTAIRSHPSQRHILAAGYQSGTLAFWDLRNTSVAMTSAAAEIHRGPIWELQFHPIYPSHLYSAGNDGQVFDWDATDVKLIGENFSISPWLLSTEQLRDQVKLTSLIPDNTMPVNSVDVVGDSILAGVDDESVWMVKNLTIS